jgi:hypothetical protein
MLLGAALLSRNLSSHSFVIASVHTDPIPVPQHSVADSGSSGVFDP